MTENNSVPDKPASPQDLARVPLPRYRSRTVVEAAKIVHVEESALILDPGPCAARSRRVKMLGIDFATSRMAGRSSASFATECHGLPMSFRARPRVAER